MKEPRAAAADQLLRPLAHLGGGLVREGDRHDVPRVHAAAHEVRQPVRDDARLARARAGQHEQRPLLRGGRLRVVRG